MILGLDISTSITGICVLNKNGEFIKAWHADLRKLDNLVDKTELVVDMICEGLFGMVPYNISNIYIEQSLSGFAAGRTSQQTIIKLAAINGAITYGVYDEFDIKPVHLHPSTIKASMKQDGLIISRGMDKKKVSLDFVRRNIKNFPYEEGRTGKPKPYCFDMCDAYMVARAGYLKFLCDKSKS